MKIAQDLTFAESICTKCNRKNYDVNAGLVGYCLTCGYSKEIFSEPILWHPDGYMIYQQAYRINGKVQMAIPHLSQ